MKNILNFHYSKDAEFSSGRTLIETFSSIPNRYTKK